MLIQIFARAPLPGQVKTRLVPALGEEGAARLYADLVRRTIREAAEAGHLLEIWCTPDETDAFFRQFPHPKFRQQGEDLGERMKHALESGLNRSSRVLLLGTDLPPLDRSYIKAAMMALEDHDLVLGPTLDGGYGLIGVQSPSPERTRERVPDIFSGPVWGESSVLEETCGKLNDLNMNYTLLPTIWDLDVPEDLPRYQAWLESGTSAE